MSANNGAGFTACCVVRRALNRFSARLKASTVDSGASVGPDAMIPVSPQITRMNYFTESGSLATSNALGAMVGVARAAAAPAR
jgi:hypothetical protein